MFFVDGNDCIKFTFTGRNSNSHCDIFGTGTVLVPWAVVCVIRGSYLQVAILVIMYLLCVLVREGLEPKLLGNRIGIPPLYTLMAVYVGVELFGLLGVILGPFGLVMIRAVLDAEKTDGKTRSVDIQK